MGLSDREERHPREEEPMLTIIDAGREVEVPARLEGERVLLSPEALRDALG
jgi:hypothetical protein